MEEKQVSVQETSQFDLDCRKAEKAALRLIARAEQCSAGLKRKLEKRNFDSDCVNKVISHLTEIKLIDDSRYALLWLESRLRLTRSPRQLISSLRARGIDRDEAETALKKVLDEEAEFSLLSRFVKKHLQKAARKNSKIERLKSSSCNIQSDQNNDISSLCHLLKSEGFSPQVISRFFDKE